MIRILAALVFSISTSFSNAGIIIDVSERSGDLVFSYSGNLDLTGMAQFGQDNNPRQLISSSQGVILSYNAPVDVYAVPALPTFGMKFLIDGITTGDDFAIFSNNYLGIKAGFASGDSLNGTLTFTEASFSSAGLFTSGSFTSTLASGDFITLRINESSSVPTPATLALFGLGLAGLGWSRRKKA